MSDQGILSKKFKALSVEDTKKALAEATAFLASTSFWRKGEEPKLKTTLCEQDLQERTFSVRPPQKTGPEELKSYLFKDQESQEFHFSTSVPRVLFFYKAKLLNYSSQKLTFRTPEIIYKVQRREHLRLPGSLTSTLWVEFEHPLPSGKRFLKRLIDISAGGLSFLVSEQEATAFSPHLILPEMKIFNGHEHLMAIAQVIHLETLPKSNSEEAIRIGVSFTKISNQHKQLIQAFVLKETSKFFSRFI